MNSICDLHQLGQSIWLDYIDRDLLSSGELRRLVEEVGVRGVTSNPSIFDKAITKSDAYDQQIADCVAANPEITTFELYEELAISDIQTATDILRPVYDESEGADGYVSLEASPKLAHDTAATMEEVRRLWKRVDRPNLMIKVPATPEGIPAIQSLLADGYNINITLMFSRDHYEAVSNAYLGGIARAPSALRPASVASVFVSRLDSKVDRALEKIGSPEALALRGKVAVANAKLIYHRFREVFDGPEFSPLRERGARLQRVLWGSTSTKNSDYSDILYVQELIGPDTVNTVPMETLHKFVDHGEARRTVDENLEEAQAHLNELAALDIDLHQVTQELQNEGVKAFADDFEDLLDNVDGKRKAFVQA